MERKGKSCCNCAHYKNYYTKGVSQFYKENKGFCMHLQEPTWCWDNCEEWKATPKRSEIQKKSVMRKLNELCNELSLTKVEPNKVLTAKSR